EEKGGAGARSGLDPDPTAQALDDALADDQAAAGPGVGVAQLQALEEVEDPIEVLAIDADAVVRDGKHPVGSGPSRSDLDPGPASGAELERVADEILEELDHQVVVRHDRGHVPAQDHGLRFLDDRTQDGQGLIDSVALATGRE